MFNTGQTTYDKTPSQYEFKLTGHKPRSIQKKSFRLPIGESKLISCNENVFICIYDFLMWRSIDLTAISFSSLQAKLHR